jgi:hypothetical protein
MSSERHQIAARFRSEGRGEAANINGQKESDMAAISSTGRNFIPSSAALMLCVPRLKKTQPLSSPPTAIWAECSNQWLKRQLR